MSNNEISFIPKSKFDLLLRTLIPIICLLLIGNTIQFIFVQYKSNKIEDLTAELEEKKSEISELDNSLEIDAIKMNYEMRLSFYENRLVIISDSDNLYYHFSNCKKLGYSPVYYFDGELSMPFSSVNQNTPYFNSNSFSFLSPAQAVEKGYSACPICRG
ncbi:MAG: hypothetical protein J1E34_09575 [Oscillospiraceae bacterium]|nr:hypothetical protein [Oscillospiraceae bacterium]